MNVEYAQLPEPQRRAEIERVKATQAKMRERMGERAYLAHRNEISRRSKAKPEVAAKINQRRRAIDRAEQELRHKFSSPHGSSPYTVLREQVRDRMTRSGELEGRTKAYVSIRLTKEATRLLKAAHPDVWAELKDRSLYEHGLS